MKQGTIEMHNEKMSTWYEAGRCTGQTRPELPCSLVTIQGINNNIQIIFIQIIKRTGLGWDNHLFSIFVEHCYAPQIRNQE